MPGRVEEAAERRRAGERAAMVLAVYHASADVEKHVAALRRARRFTVSCFPQRSAPRRAPVAGADGVLWELAPGRPPDPRRVASIAGGLPVVSYSTQGGREVLDLSRSIGFVSHLRAPLRPVEVEHQLALVARSDLALRLQRSRRLVGRLRTADAFLQMLRAANATLDPAGVADVLAGRAAEWSLASRWAVVAADETGAVQVLGERGVAAVEPAALAIGAWVLRHEALFLTSNVAEDRRVPAPAAVAAIGVPLLCRGRAIGALVGMDRGPSGREPRVGARLAAALQGVLEPAALALDNAMRVQRVEALSVTDDLTQLYNSRYLSQVLRRETKRASRSGRPLSLLFVDLDGFKGINDAHGHLSGSRALVEAAAVIRASARETDMVARYGGDEFALVLPDTGSEGAMAVGERVRERIAAWSFLADEGLNVRLTASVGVATLPDVAASVEGLLQAADRAMYRVKEHGKNAICVATNDL